MKHFDPATATSNETNQQKKRLIKKLRKGSKSDRALAEQLLNCTKDARCGLSDCPVCATAKLKQAARRVDDSPREVKNISISKIKLLFNQRPIVESELDVILKSIKINGMRQPITVVALDEGYGLADGGYRLEAHKRLGATKIRCFVENDQDAAQRWNLAANLSHVDLSPLQRARDLTAYIAVVQEQLKGGQLAHPVGRQPHDKGYSRVEEDLGWSRRTIQRAAGIARLTPEAEKVAIELGLDRNESKLLVASEQSDGDTQIAKLRELSKGPHNQPTAARAKTPPGPSVSGEPTAGKTAPSSSTVSPSPAAAPTPAATPSQSREATSSAPAAVAVSRANDTAQEVRQGLPTDKPDPMDIPQELKRLTNEEQTILDEMLALWHRASANVRSKFRDKIGQTFT